MDDIIQKEENEEAIRRYFFFKYYNEGRLREIGEAFNGTETGRNLYADKRKAAKTLISYCLEMFDGKAPSNSVFEILEGYNISKRTIYSIKKEMRIGSLKEGDVWFWVRPPGGFSALKQSKAVRR